MTLIEALNNIRKAIDEESERTFREYEEAKFEVFNEYEHHRKIWLAGKINGLARANDVIFRMIETLGGR